jgi:hypothetical protein
VYLAAPSRVGALAEIRASEDAIHQRLVAVRGQLDACVALAAELPLLEERLARAQRLGGPYRAQSLREIEERIDGAHRASEERRALRAQEARLLTELEGVRGRLAERGIRKALPLVDQVVIASPCNVSWASMDGDGDVRHCGLCDKNVYNLSLMTRDEAEAALGAHPNMCARFYRRSDGTLLTQDCPVGQRRARFWRRTRGIAAAGLILAALGDAAWRVLMHEVEVAGEKAADRKSVV